MGKLSSVEKVTEGIRSLARSSFELPPASTTSTAAGRLPPVTVSGGSIVLHPKQVPGRGSRTAN